MALGEDAVCTLREIVDIAHRPQDIADEEAMRFFAGEDGDAEFQPLIVSYEDYRPPTFSWVNIWSRMDIISGSLEYYEDPPTKVPQIPPERRVHNFHDPQAWVPFAAHVQYWHGKLLRQQLYRYVS